MNTILGSATPVANTVQYNEVYQFLIDKLEQELPAYLLYHNVGHTKSVVEVAEQLGIAEGISDAEMILVTTAALFHDAGYLEDYNNHEEISCRLAREMLPQYNYSDAQIEEICRLIMATKMPHVPASHLERIICDADLHYLGTDRYFGIAEALFAELKEIGQIKQWREWRNRQVNFLEKHQFFTPSAIKLYDFKKKQNLLQFKSIRREHHWNSGIFSWTNMAQDAFLIVLGVITTGFALNGFLVPNKFFDGGVTGISLLVHELYHTNLAYTIVLANLPLIAISYFTVSKSFALKTFFCVLLLGVCLLYFPYPIITNDKLLISIFGGFFLGLGVGLSMRAGCALDGIEVLALYTWKKTSFTVTEIILFINILIFIIAAFEISPETALYSILTYFTASKTIDYVIEGIEAYTGVTIISGNSDIIKYRLVNEMGRSITVYKGERGYLPGNFEVSSDCDIIFTVITRLELRKLKNLVHQIDPKAFVFASTIKEATGGILKRRQVH